MSETVSPAESAESARHTACISSPRGGVLHLRRVYLLDLRSPGCIPAPRTVSGAVEAVSTGGWRVTVAEWTGDGFIVTTDPAGVAVGLHVPGVGFAPVQSVAALCVPPLFTLFDPEHRWARLPLGSPFDPDAQERYTAERDWAIAQRLHAIGLDLVAQHSKRTWWRGGRRLDARPYRQDLEWAVLPGPIATDWRTALAEVRNTADPRLAEWYATGGWAPQEAAPWIASGFHPLSEPMRFSSAARRFAAAGWTPREATALIEHVATTWPGELMPARQCAAWVDTGLSPQVALLALSAGLASEEAHALHERGGLDEAALRARVRKAGRARVREMERGDSARASRDTPTPQGAVILLRTEEDLARWKALRDRMDKDLARRKATKRWLRRS